MRPYGGGGAEVEVTEVVIANNDTKRLEQTLQAIHHTVAALRHLTCVADALILLNDPVPADRDFVVGLVNSAIDMETKILDYCDGEEGGYMRKVKS